jgi:hypothetical protein
MLSPQEILDDLRKTQECIDIGLDKKDYESIKPYSEKISMIIAWLMQNGWVES